MYQDLSSSAQSREKTVIQFMELCHCPITGTYSIQQFRDLDQSVGLGWSLMNPVDSACQDARTLYPWREGGEETSYCRPLGSL
uniref:Uncharacterized protein n=1 Tax=Anguilla anguilla TaxID=7936 RepID=A0A0E9VZG3_ANGAN